MVRGRSRFAFVSTKATPGAGSDTGLRIDIAVVAPDGTVSAQQAQEFAPGNDHELDPDFIPGTDKLLFNTRENNVDLVWIGTPGVPGGTSMGPGSATGGGIDDVIAPDGKSALVLFWTEQKTYLYDLVKPGATPIDLGPTDLSTYQRKAF